MQFNLSMKESSWRPPNISDLPSWRDAKRISIDCETRDDSLKTLGIGTRRGGYTVGWGFAIEGVGKWYLPYRHLDGSENLPEQQVLSYLKDNAAIFTGEIVGANLSYDLEWAIKDGIIFHPSVVFRDVQVADPLIYELHRSYSLLNIGHRLGVEGKYEEVLNESAQSMGLDPKSELWKMPARFVGEYAENDVTSPLLIYAKQRELLDKNDLWRVFNMESKLIPILVKMRQRGVRIDLDKLEEIETWAKQEEQNAMDSIKTATGVRVSVGDSMKVGALLPVFENLGITLGTTPKGSPKIDADFLESSEHPVLLDIRHARKMYKIQNTYVNGIKNHLIGDRIHCTFNQIAREDEKGEQKGVRYGRMSASDPNMQNQPNPDKDPKLTGRWRKIFIPDEGMIWGCCDYSQQEPRWIAHYADKLGLPKGKEVVDRYIQDPTIDSHDMMTRIVNSDQVVDGWLVTNDKETFKKNRGRCKMIYLGICYGEGGAALCKELGLETRWAVVHGRGRGRRTDYYTTMHEAYMEKSKIEHAYVYEAAGEEGQSILNKFDLAVPYVKLLTRKASSTAKDRKFVKTIMGRRLHFTEKNGKVDWPHKAFNRVIQGSGADQMKLAMIACDDAGILMQLQVHDELNGSFVNREEANVMGDIMRDSIHKHIKTRVPFKVDTECGKNWAEVS